MRIFGASEAALVFPARISPEFRKEDDRRAGE
jgi:hypothetical protein